MRPNLKQYPFYLKATVILLGLVIVTFILITWQDMLSPIAFALLIAILLNPLVVRLQKLNIPEVAAICIALLLATLVIGGIIYFLSSQIASFGDNLPVLKQKFSSLLTDFQSWLRVHFGISLKNQLQMVNDALKDNKAVVGQTVGTVLNTLGLMFLIPIYVFMFLIYKNLMLNFLFEVFAEENSAHVSQILNQTKVAIQSYMVGLLIEAAIVAVLNCTALLILGVEYAILLGIIGALLNIIPYIGGIIAIILPVLIATITKNGFSTQLYIIISFLAIQVVHNNILVPKIVSSKVQINALFSIIIVLVGGAIWGIGGMFLSMPFAAILKIVFDCIDDLKPWGKLLGTVVPTKHKGNIWRRARSKPSVSETIVQKNEKN
jgi:predicted PurR-regulated permease PerM